MLVIDFNATSKYLIAGILLLRADIEFKRKRPLGYFSVPSQIARIQNQAIISAKVYPTLIFYLSSSIKFRSLHKFSHL
jgi:hypothetical protein